ncbi:hypothetical protein DCC79_09055 [bacterium]|nr:MAG: hypothetical protein DCC79_09055 [bacterium]
MAMRPHPCSCERAADAAPVTGPRRSVRGRLLTFVALAAVAQAAPTAAQTPDSAWTAPRATAAPARVPAGDTRQPRPVMTGRVGQGSGACAAVPSDAASMTVTLVQDNGDAVCDAADVDTLDLVGVSASTGWYLFAADDSWSMTDPDPAYCVVVDRASEPDPAPFGPIHPGVDPEAEFTIDPICVE